MQHSLSPRGPHRHSVPPHRQLLLGNSLRLQVPSQQECSCSKDCCHTDLGVVEGVDERLAAPLLVVVHTCRVLGCPDGLHVAN